mgnify:CR=1 FL=1
MNSNKISHTSAVKMYKQFKTSYSLHMQCYIIQNIMLFHLEMVDLTTGQRGDCDELTFSCHLLPNYEALITRVNHVSKVFLFTIACISESFIDTSKKALPSTVFGLN